MEYNIEPFLLKRVDAIQTIIDGSYTTTSNDPSLAYMMTAKHIVLDNYRKKVEPYLTLTRGNCADSFVPELRVFLDTLHYKDYLQKINLCEYAPFTIDPRDILFLVFMSFSDFCVDELNLDPRVLYTRICSSDNHLEQYAATVRGDIEKYQHAFARFGIAFTDYRDIAAMIIESETASKISDHDVLYHRLRSNYALMLGMKYTVIPGLNADQKMELLLHFFTFFVFFDDVEDYIDDIRNDTPTTISRLYETSTPAQFVTHCNMLLYYTYTQFMETVKTHSTAYFHVLDIIKSIYLKLHPGAV